MASIAVILCGCDHILAQSNQSTDAELQVRIAELIDQLGDPVYQRRRNAKWSLERIGLPAYEQLRVASEKHPDIEVANSARYIVRSQKVKWHIETDSADVREILASYDQAC